MERTQIKNISNNICGLDSSIDVIQKCKELNLLTQGETNIKNFENLSKDEIYDHRKSKFLQIGRDQGFSKSTNIGDSGLSYKESGIKKLKFHILQNKYIYGGIGLVVIVGLIASLF